MLGRHFADDLAALVGRRDVGHGFDAFDDGGLKLLLWVRRIAHRVEPVRNDARLEVLAITRSQRRTELRFVGVGGLVQVDVHQELELALLDKNH